MKNINKTPKKSFNSQSKVKFEKSESETLLEYIRDICKDTTIISDRIFDYNTFKKMDRLPEVSSMLNTTRDEILNKPSGKKLIKVSCENDKAKFLAEKVLNEILCVDFNLRLWVRDLLKYGDYFVFLNIDKELGIYDPLTLPMEEVHREEGYDGKKNVTRFLWETTNEYFSKEEILHFRLLEDGRKFPYGTSFLNNSSSYFENVIQAEEKFNTKKIRFYKKELINSLKLKKKSFINIARESILTELTEFVKIHFQIINEKMPNDLILSFSE